jgi:anti-anti-sigma factor
MAEATSLKISDQGGVTVIGFKESGILDAATIQRIGRELYEVVEKQGRKQIILDFSNVRFLSSQALGVLLTFRRKADSAQAKVALAALRPELRRVFSVTNLDKLFTFHETKEAALAAFGVSAPPSGA